MILLTLQYRGGKIKKLFKSYKNALKECEKIIENLEKKGNKTDKISDDLITIYEGQYELGRIVLESVLISD